MSTPPQLSEITAAFMKVLEEVDAAVQNLNLLAGGVGVYLRMPGAFDAIETYEGTSEFLLAARIAIETAATLLEDVERHLPIPPSSTS
ncbi:hypothetical protein JT358_11650 [Micrococcales bacterium 31B]|nr:hypothetical protein [Micrococcales bacterium 31B]